MKIWKWLSSPINSFPKVLFWLLIITWLLLAFKAPYWPYEIPSTPTTCNHTAEIQQLIDKIDEQGQLIGVYEFRYRGLGVLP